MFLAFWAYSVKRRRIKVNLKSHRIRDGFYIVHCVFVGKMNQGTAFAALKMNVLVAMAFRLGTLIYKSVVYRRLVFCKKPVFCKPVQIAVDGRFVYFKPVFFQKIRKFRCGKNLFKPGFYKRRDEFRCFCVINFLQHGCILCNGKNFVKRKGFIFLRIEIFLISESRMNHEKSLIRKTITFFRFSLTDFTQALKKNRLFCKIRNSTNAPCLQ